MMSWAASSGLKKRLQSTIRTRKQSVLRWWPRMVSLKPAWRANSLAPIGRINWLVNWKEMEKDRMVHIVWNRKFKHWKMSSLTKKKDSYFSNIFKIRIQRKSCMMRNKSYNNTYSTYFAKPLFGHPTLKSDFAAILFQSFNKLSSNSAVMKILFWVHQYKHGWSKIQMSRSKFRKQNRRFLILVESEQSQSAYR